MGRGLDPSYHLRGEIVDKQVLLKLLHHYNEMLLERIAYLENKKEEAKQYILNTDYNKDEAFIKLQTEINDCKLRRYTTIAHIQILEKEVE